MPTESEQDAILLEMARERGWLHKPCTHDQVRPVQCHDANVGWFVAYQCDGCGMITRQTVPMDLIEAGHDLPKVDWQAYGEALRRVHGPDDMTTLAFLGRAIGR